MSKPFWFNIIQQWKQMGKGEYGVTFPFLAGAVARNSNREPDEEFVIELFEEMKNSPVEGYFCEVRWCGNIKEPVVSINSIKNSSKISLQAEFRVNEIISVGFTSDLLDIFHLNCQTFDEGLAKLISYTLDIVQSGKFSKNGGLFTPFTPGDIDFIDSVQKQKNT